MATSQHVSVAINIVDGHLDIRNKIHVLGIEDAGVAKRGDAYRII